jgi:hypothetical protein
VIVKDAQYQTKHFIMEEIKKYAKKDLQAEIKKSVQQQPNVSGDESLKTSSKG